MYILKVVATMVCFLALDALWISLFAKPLYADVLQSLMADRGGLDFALGAILAYSMLLLGLFVFVLPSAQPILYGFVFGVVVYGVYGLTNYVVVDAWTWSLVLTDWVWGGVLYAATAYFAQVIGLTS